MRAPMVHLDLDGVLFDLEGGLKAFTGLADPTADRGKLFSKHLPNYTAANGFALQPAMKNAHLLVDRLVEMMDDGHILLGILTSAGDFFKPISEVVLQKKRSIEINFPRLIKVPFATTCSGADKSYYAHPNSMLIDDHGPNVSRFINAGGYGVVYHPEEVETVLAQVENFYQRASAA